MGTKKTERINTEESSKIESLLSQKLFTIQDVVNALDCKYTENQIKYHVNKNYPHLKGNFKKEYSKGGTKLEYLLKQLFPARLVEAEVHVGERLRVDFVVGSPYNIAFEFDGTQHHNYSIHLHGSRSAFREASERDQRKDFLVAKRGLTLVRISDLDIDLEKLSSLISSVGYGTGVIDEAYLTKQELASRRTREQRTRIQEARKAYEKVLQATMQKRVVQKSPSMISKEDEYKQKQRDYRKQQYQKAKEWRKKMKDNS